LITLRRDIQRLNAQNGTITKDSDEQTSSHRSKDAPWRRKSGTGICHWKSNTFAMMTTTAPCIGR